MFGLKYQSLFGWLGFSLVVGIVCANQTSNEIHDVNFNRASVIEWLLSNWSLGGHTTTEIPEVLEKPKDCVECKCGLVNIRRRIVGGSETKINQYPWMAMLFYNGRFYCGASLVSSMHVMTAAHCVHGFDAQKISVRLREHDRSIDNETDTIDRKVDKIYRHPGYSTRNFNNDIAILRMNEPVVFTHDFRPVCMPARGAEYAGSIGTVTGWGATKQSGSVAVRLNEVDVPIMSNEECKKTAYGSKRITDNMLCAGYPEGKKDACQGDSGGPLHVKEASGVHKMVGIVSWGEGCAEPQYPGVYSKVSRFISWINSKIADGCVCDEPSAGEAESFYKKSLI